MSTRAGAWNVSNHLIIHRSQILFDSLVWLQSMTKYSTLGSMIYTKIRYTFQTFEIAVDALNLFCFYLPCYEELVGRTHSSYTICQSIRLFVPNRTLLAILNKPHSLSIISTVSHP